MERRSLHAVLLSGVADATRLAGPLAAALDGTGPAILPLDAGLPAARLHALLDAFRPDVVVGAAETPPAVLMDRGQHRIRRWWSAPPAPPGSRRAWS